MQLHELRRRSPNKRSRQIGRGGKRGTTAGRGTKGQKARAGRKLRPELRDIIKKIPKQRGRGIHPFKSLVAKAHVVTTTMLGASFTAGETVTVAELVKRGLVRSSNRTIRVKILLAGPLNHALTISGIPVSATAKEAILAAGGHVG